MIFDNADAVIFIAHGSKRVSANESFLDFINRAVSQSDCRKAAAASFLQFGSPSPEEAFRELYENGFRKFAVFPWFLQEGSHVQKDIPAFVKLIQKQYPDTEFCQLTCLGSMKELEELLIKTLE